MTHENLMIMDSATTKINKKPHIKITRTLAIVLIVVFVFVLILTGVLVYNFTPCCTIKSLESVNECKSDTTTTTTPTTTVATPTTIPNLQTHPQFTTTESTKSVENKIIKNLRLPLSIHPISYQLRLIPFIEEGNFTYNGEVAIRLNVTETCSNVTLHAKDLTIFKVFLVEVGGNRIPIKQLQNDTGKDFLIVDLNQKLKPGRIHLLYIEFSGILNDLMQGFYRSSYMENNRTRWLAATQFQPTDARRAFPCFDEPAMKATFEISIARLKNMTALSNMPKIATNQPYEKDPNFVWDHFQESVPMSTYLVAFCVSDFKNISNGIFSIWARSSALSQAQYSLKIGPVILKYYERFFGIKYPLPKLDMVALPDFGAGAMENWGLITYRESTLLYEEGVSERSSLQHIARIVAHELAHQWFGNLVTPNWWSDLWLNEGFASFVEVLGAHEVDPEWKDPDLFVVNNLHNSFSLDVLKSSHQISVNVTNPDEVNEIFDSISYAKSASIIRMMEQFLSPRVFRNGLNMYLKRNMYGNAEQDDLWVALTAQSHSEGVLPTNLTIKEIMDTWTLQTGFPVVQIERDYTKNSIKLKQERFLINKVENNTNFWWIPITFTDSSRVLTRIWMSKYDNELILTNISTESDDWLLVNVNQTGYYRVNYDLNNWALIIEQLTKQNGHLVFDVKNRAQIIDDALNLASSGYIGYDLALNLTLYLKQEKEYIAWTAAIGQLMYLQNMFERTAHFDKFKTYMLDLLDNIYKDIGFKATKAEDPLRYLSRIMILHCVCKLGLRDCIINAVQQFQNWKNTANPDRDNIISPNVRDVVYCHAISDGGQEEWDFAWQRYLNTNVASEQDILLTSLGCSKEPWILTRYLEWAFTENSGIRKQDVGAVFLSIATNPVGGHLAYSFLKNNWNRIRTYLGTSSYTISEILSSCSTNFNTKQEIDDFRSFVKSKENELGMTQRKVQQLLENAEAKLKWMENYFQKIVTWLMKYSNS